MNDTASQFKVYDDSAADKFGMIKSIIMQLYYANRDNWVMAVWLCWLTITLCFIYYTLRFAVRCFLFPFYELRAWSIALKYECIYWWYALRQLRK